MSNHEPYFDFSHQQKITPEIWSPTLPISPEFMAQLSHVPSAVIVGSRIRALHARIHHPSNFADSSIQHEYLLRPNANPDLDVFLSVPDLLKITPNPNPSRTEAGAYNYHLSESNLTVDLLGLPSSSRLPSQPPVEQWCQHHAAFAQDTLCATPNPDATLNLYDPLYVGVQQQLFLPLDATSPHKHSPLRAARSIIITCFQSPLPHHAELRFNFQNATTSFKSIKTDQANSLLELLTKLDQVPSTSQQRLEFAVNLITSGALHNLATSALEINQSDQYLPLINLVGQYLHIAYGQVSTKLPPELESPLTFCLRPPTTVNLLDGLMRFCDSNPSVFIQHLYSSSKKTATPITQ